MALAGQITTNEQAKFALDDDGNTAVRTVGNSRPRGLNKGGKFTSVEINPTTWTALPATPLEGRNSMSIQNRTGNEIVLNYLNNVSGFTGMVIDHLGERYYDITDAIVIYAKSKAAIVSVGVEELA